MQKNKLMISELNSAIIENGYWAILLLVFLQEVGVPSPVPNELVLLFSGYLVFRESLSFSVVVVSAVAGDLLGSTILYIAFYYFGEFILSKLPARFPLSRNKIDRLSLKLNRHGRYGIFVGRVSPFIRGYVSVLCGFIRFSPRRFSLILLSSAVVWSVFYVAVGYCIAPVWSRWIVNSDNSFIQIISFAVISLLCLFFWIWRRVNVRRKSQIANS